MALALLSLAGMGLKLAPVALALLSLAEMGRPAQVISASGAKLHFSRGLCHRGNSPVASAWPPISGKP